MFGVSIGGRKPDAALAALNANLRLRLLKRRLKGIEAEIQRYETECWRESAETRLAHRNRNHTLLDDNPCSG
jgi:hypothetical protein